MNAPLAHLAAFSSLLARDKDAGRLNTRHVQLVCLLCAQDGPVTVGHVATMAALPSWSVSRLADKLIDHGLITRTRDTHDDRRVFLAPTAEGRALDARVREHFATATAA